MKEAYCGRIDSNGSGVHSFSDIKHRENHYKRCYRDKTTFTSLYQRHEVS
jgi:hypothetical protein